MTQCENCAVHFEGIVSEKTNLNLSSVVTPLLCYSFVFLCSILRVVMHTIITTLYQTFIS